MGLESQTDRSSPNEGSPDFRITLLGAFSVNRKCQDVPNELWGRDKAIQLFQFLLLNTRDKLMHREQIIDRLWPDAGIEAGLQNFKVSLHAISKTLEPDKASRSPSALIIRKGLAYGINFSHVWLDIYEMESLITQGNDIMTSDPDVGITLLRKGIGYFKGSLLPDRLYEDWTAGPREYHHVMALNAMTRLAELVVMKNPDESIGLTQKALLIDPAWEDAYRIQMKAFIAKGNRPMAIKSYNTCKEVLWNEYGIEPLPQTRSELREIEQM